MCLFILCHRWERKRKLEQPSAAMWQCKRGCPVPRWAAQVPQQVLTAVTCLTSLIHRPFPLSFPIPRPFFQSLLIILLDSTFPPSSSPSSSCSLFHLALLPPLWLTPMDRCLYFRHVLHLWTCRFTPPPLPFFLKMLGQWDVNMWGTVPSVPNSEQRQLCLQNLETTAQLQIEILRIKATTRNPSLVTMTYG